MNNKTKVLLSAILTIAMCLSVIAGSTLALFTSESSTSISVTSGKVSVEASLAIVETYSAKAQEDGTLVDENGAKYVYEANETRGVFANSGTATLNAGNDTLTLDRVTPGDKVSLTLDIANHSNVNIIYRIVIGVENDNGLFEALTFTVDGDPISRPVYATNWAPIEANGSIASREIDVILPIDAGNLYQEKTATINFKVEAVQGNAAISLLDQLNGALSAQPELNATMKDALTDVAGVAGEAEIKSHGYVWDSKIDQFVQDTDVTADYARYFKIYDEMPASQTFSIYASADWATANVAGLTVGFDAGDATVSSVSYDRSAATVGQTVIIRTNSAGTNLTINAPLDTVHRYGAAGTVTIIAIAGSSYHENGTVAFLEIAKGRVALEKEAEVEQIHISSIKDETTGQTTNEFAPIVIAIAEEVEQPTFSRDDVAIAAGGTLVVALQTGTEEVTEETALDYVWLTKQGIFEQMKVSDNPTSAGDVWADDDKNSEETQKAAAQIANNIGRNESTKAVETTVTVAAVEYTVTLDSETRDLVVVETSTEETVEATETVAAAVTKAVERTGLDDTAKAAVIEEKVDEAAAEEIAEQIENGANYVARIGAIGYETFGAAFEAAKDGEKIQILQDVPVSDTAENPLFLKDSSVPVTVDGYKYAIGRASDNVDYILYDDGDIYIYNTAAYTGKTFTVPTFVNGLGGSSFTYNTTIRTLIMTNPIDSAYKALQNNSTITTVDLGNMTSIPNRMFYGCTGIKLLTIPSSVKRIEDFAFYANEAIEFVFAEDVEYVGYKAFDACSALRVLDIGGENVQIMGWAGRQVKSIEKIIIRGANATVDLSYAPAGNAIGAYVFCKTQQSGNPGTMTGVEIYVANDAVAAAFANEIDTMGATRKNIVSVSDVDELNAALADGNLALFTNNITCEAALTAPYGNKMGVEQGNGGVIDGNGYTLSVTGGGDTYAIMTKGGLIMNIETDEAFRGIYIMYPAANVYLYNVTSGRDGVCYAMNTGERGDPNVRVYALESTFEGWTSFNLISSVTFISCTFGQGTLYNNFYGRFVRPYVNTVFDGCDFLCGYYLDLSALEAGKKVTLKNCTVNGVVLTAENVTNVSAVPSGGQDAGETTTVFYELPNGRSLEDCVIFA